MLEENEEIDVVIENMGEKGDGIARCDGMVIFVPDTREQEKYRIKITRVMKKYAFAKKIMDL